MGTLLCGLADCGPPCITPSFAQAHICFFLFAHGARWEKVALEVIPVNYMEHVCSGRPWDCGDELCWPLTVPHTVDPGFLVSHEINGRVRTVEKTEHSR